MFEFFIATWKLFYLPTRPVQSENRQRGVVLKPSQVSVDRLTMSVPRAGDAISVPVINVPIEARAYTPVWQGGGLQARASFVPEDVYLKPYYDAVSKDYTAQMRKDLHAIQNLYTKGHFFQEDFAERALNDLSETWHKYKMQIVENGQRARDEKEAEVRLQRAPSVRYEPPRPQKPPPPLPVTVARQEARTPNQYGMWSVLRGPSRKPSFSPTVNPVVQPIPPFRATPNVIRYEEKPHPSRLRPADRNDPSRVHYTNQPRSGRIQDIREFVPARHAFQREAYDESESEFDQHDNTSEGHLFAVGHKRWVLDTEPVYENEKQVTSGGIMVRREIFIPMNRRAIGISGTPRNEWMYYPASSASKPRDYVATGVYASEYEVVR